MAREAYKAKLQISFILNNQTTEIGEKLVKYIMIENLYESRFMPVIYVSLSLGNELYTKIVENEKAGKIYLCIQKYNAYSGSALYKDYIKGQFTYILSTSNPNYSEELVGEDDQADAAYRTVTIALMSMELLNLSKTSFNGVYGNIDENTIIMKAMEGMPAVIKKPKYNPTFDTIMIPAMNSKKKLLKYIFQKCPFYDTNYMFFMDFNKAYLLDLTGESCPANDGQLNSIIIDIRKVTAEESYYEGMEVKNGAYALYVNPGQTNISENKGQDKVSNQFVFVEDTGAVDYVDLNINNHVDSDLKQSFKRGGNAKLYKNIAESNTVIIEMTKDNIDGSMITPNKEFYINNYEDYADYNGKYTLLYKKEIITNNNGSFGLSVCFALRKVGNIVALGDQVAISASKKSASPRHKYSTKGNSKTTSTTNPNGTASSKQLPPVRRMKATSEFASLKRRPREL